MQMNGYGMQKMMSIGVPEGLRFYLVSRNFSGFLYLYNYLELPLKSRGSIFTAPSPDIHL
jgi:hypothetical protein